MEDSAAPLTAERFAVWADFVLAHTLVMREIETRLRRESGLSWAHYDVLYNLNAEPAGELSVSALTRTLLYSSGSASKLIAAMERAGLVAREQSEVDRRVMLIRPTAAGRDAFGTATTAVLEIVRDTFSSLLPDADLPAVAGFLQRVREQDPKLRRPPYDLPVDLG